MRYTDILNEKIVTQPFDRKRFLTRAATALRTASAHLGDALAVIDKLDRKGDGEYVLRYALGVANNGDRPFLPSVYGLNLNRRDGVKHLAENLEAIINYGVSDFLRYAISSIEHFEDIDPEYRKFLALVPHTEAGFIEYGYEPGKSYPDDDEYRDACALRDAYLAYMKAREAILTVVEKVRPILNDLVKRQQHTFDPQKYHPDHGPIEMLYHATAYATEITKEGFAAEKPVERRGLGNYGDQPTISFTHSFKIAHDIMRGMREIWMIVHGQLTFRTILGWIRNEGLDEKRAQSLFITRDEARDSVYNTVGLYRAYLGLSKLRTDPVFASAHNLIPMMQNRDIKDIGIISCVVRLDDEAEYMAGENEFRVPVSKVAGPVTRVI